MSADRAAKPELTLREKVQYLLETTFPNEKVSGRRFAQIVEEKGGSLSNATFSNILSGKVTVVSEDTLKALGLGFGVDWRYFKDESEVEADVVAGLQFLAEKRAGHISGIAGRGIADTGLPADLLQFALGLVAEEKQRRAAAAGEPAT
ncbi:hypothetical protein GTY75_09210 [Streptomyces sp. SID8381]|uniref:hypothetical protein n=1 Tax=unclassified Streptomyces TaxID=2593676 RepID=UPI00036ED8E1|nr:MULTISPECIES: hypothetical protein [unclassified Streptomyces]MYX26845.1 hypothetical protein [Streptomyces sp. SID8381]